MLNLILVLAGCKHHHVGFLWWGSIFILVIFAAGLLINKLRNRLSSDIIDSIIFLNKNSIPRDMKKDATESDFANVVGM